MKNYFIVLGFISFLGCAFAYEKVYLQDFSVPNNPRYNTRYNVQRPCGCHSRMYYNPCYSYSPKYNSDELKRIRRFNNIIRLQRLRNSLSWNGFQKFDPKGYLTGYSVPVTNDVYNQIGITPYDPKKPANTKTTTGTQELFSMPQGDETIYKNGKRYRNLGGVSGKTGVTVIYD